MRPIRSSLLALVLLVSAVTAHAGAIRLEPWRGHVAVGYGKLWSDALAPGGSISVAGGVDYPVSPSLRVGPVIGLALLGSHDVQRGSIVAGVDYSLLDVALQAHWTPPSGIVSRVSFGPGIGVARAALQVGGGGAGFLDLAVDEVKPEFALDVSAIPRRMKVVAVGLESGVRIVPVSRTTWVLGTVRLTIHY